MEKARIMEILTKTDAMLEGHFQLTSGRHSDKYAQCAHLFQHPEYAMELTGDLAEKIRPLQPDLVVGPAVGGIIIAYELARQLGVRNIFAERQDGKMTLRRNFTINPGERVVVAEDVITTGGSVQEVIDLVREAGGVPVGVGLIVDRSMGKAAFDIPHFSCIKLDVVSWTAEECPLCKEGVAVTKPGSRNLK